SARNFINTGIGIDASGDTIAAQVVLDGTEPFRNGPGIVHVFKRTAGVYSRTATLMAGAWRLQPASFGYHIAVSGDGGTLAIGDTDDNGLGAGVQKPPLTPGQAPLGGVYIY